MRTYILLIFVINYCSLFAVDFDYSAYYKNFLLDFRTPKQLVKNTNEYINAQYFLSMLETLRLDTSFAWSENFSSELSYAFFFNYQNSNLAELTYETNYRYRLVDLKNSFLVHSFSPQKQLLFLQNLDRINIKYTNGSFEFTLGRQSIYFGSSKFVSPFDVLQVFTFQALDTENRIGVDALRATLYTGTMGKLDLGYVFGKDFDVKKSAIFLNRDFYFLNTNISFLSVLHSGSLMLGLGFNRNLGDASIYCETSYTLGDVLNTNVGVAKDYFRLSLGLDYNFTENTYYNVEYHYNGAGEETVRGYINVYRSMPYLDGTTYLLARHYLQNSIMYQLTPLTSLSAQLVLNLNDGSSIVPLLVSRSFSDNIVVSLGLVFSMGKYSSVDQSLNTSFGSEFGSYPSYIYTDLRWYF